jgi:hypothetical protein
MIVQAAIFLLSYDLHNTKKYVYRELIELR